jgi:hypothetical protein
MEAIAATRLRRWLGGMEEGGSRGEAVIGGTLEIGI